MNIVSIKYAVIDNSTIAVTLDDGTVMYSAQPCQTWHNGLIQEWLDEGNTIEPYE